jgi:hypothetical protein
MSRLLSVAWAAISIAAGAGELYVHNVRGSNTNVGTREHPLLTAQTAVNRARPGDTIHLLPEGGLYRESILIRGKTNIVIDGHGVTMSGADPLPREGWETVGEGRRRIRRKRTAHDRHLLIRNGKAVRMGRSPSIRKEFPAPELLQPGEFSWELIDEETGWLHVNGPVAELEWSVRMAGVATSGASRDITIRNLTCRHALNDGFNIHGDCRGLRCFDIRGYENFDEGFSAHDTCTARVERGRFWGNDNAVADVNFADTYYKDCEFSRSLSTDVLFSGGDHRLENCRITASGRTAFSLSTGGHPKFAERSLGVCVLLDCRIEASDDQLRPIRIAADCTATFERSELRRIEISAQGELKAIGSTRDGKPWRRNQ